MFKRRDWTTCSKYAKYSKPNNKLGGGVYDHLTSTRIHFDNEYDMHTDFEYDEAMAMGMIWICYLSCTNCVSHLTISGNKVDTMWIWHIYLILSS